MPPLLIADDKTKRCLFEFGFNTAAAPQGTMWDFQQKKTKKQKNGWIDDRIAVKWFRKGNKNFLSSAAHNAFSLTTVHFSTHHMTKDAVSS